MSGQKSSRLFAPQVSAQIRGGSKDAQTLHSTLTLNLQTFLITHLPVSKAEAEETETDRSCGPS
jgi:hypothetical protein